jgi:epoxyqueuosine reductase
MKTGIRALAKEHGFADCRFAKAAPAPHAIDYFSWLESGNHGEMAWLERDPARRADPGRVLLGAKTVLVLDTNYFQGRNPRQHLGKLPATPGCRLSPIMVGTWFDRRRINGCQSVTSIPVNPSAFCRRWAFCSSEHQSPTNVWVPGSIGVILTTLEFEPDPPVKNRCGSCTRCIDICPTRAITLPYHLDARRCISYLTIENKGPIPVEFRPAIGDRIYGCDDCLEVCPWNRFAQQTREIRFLLPTQLATLTLRQLAALTEDEFRVLFRDSPVKRIKRARFIRNVCVALGNVGTREDLEVLKQLVSGPDPLITEHAAWAVEQIVSREGGKAEVTGVQELQEFSR